MTGEQIELDVPLHARFASTVRAVAASVGADQGLSVDEIDDLRLGVNEAVALLADVDDATDGRLHIRFEVADAVVTVTCERRGVDGGAVDIDALARRILDAVVDEYSESVDRISLVKRAVPARSHEPN